MAFLREARHFGPAAKKVVGLVNRNNGQEPGIKTSQPERPPITFVDTYHGKVVPLEKARQLVTIHEDVRLPDLEKIVPYQRARAIIMTNPDHIAVLDCPCRASRAKPFLPVYVCLIVGESFASYIIEHHPQSARWISQQEAQDILEAEHNRGHVHHAFFKDAMLDRFYAICNCCSCCCGAMQVQQSGKPMLASSGYVAHVDENLCMNCGRCRRHCQFQAMVEVDHHSQIVFDKCMGCGVCLDQCRRRAITLEREPAKGEPLEILALMAQMAIAN